MSLCSKKPGTIGCDNKKTELTKVSAKGLAGKTSSSSGGAVTHKRPTPLKGFSK